jgi:prepilin-type N-terminal cleavage/methylation domain-containing protein
MVKRNRGYTLAELLIASAILAVIFSLGSNLLIKVNTFFKISIAKVEVQRDVRALMELMTREIRDAQASTVSLSRLNASQPPYSYIQFDALPGYRGRFWQDGQKLIMEKIALLPGGPSQPPTVMSKDLRSLMFLYPSTDNPNLLTILITLEKRDGTGRTQSVQLGGETIRLLND